MSAVDPLVNNATARGMNGSAGQDAAAAGLSMTDVVRILGRHWAAIVLATLLGIAMAGIWLALQPRTFTSDATAIVTAGVSDNVGLAFSADSLSKSKATQYESLVGSRNVAAAAVEETGLDVSPQTVARSVSGTVPVDTAMVKISVEWSDPVEAQQLADAWVSAMSEEVHGIENQGASSDGNADAAVESAISLSPMVPANVPVAPSSPNIQLGLGIGAFMGLSGGLAFAFIRHQFDRRIRSAQALEDSGVAVIGTIPVAEEVADERRLQSQGQLGSSHSSFRVREAFKELRTNLQFMNPDHPPRIITVTSALPGDGKSTTAANLAVSLAEAGEEVLIVDADLRKPTVAKTFGVEGSVGLSDMVVGRVNLEDVLIQDIRYPSLRILPAGQIPPNPSEILASDRLRTQMLDLSLRYMIILDAPPLLPVTDAAVLATRFDGAIVVVQANVTRIDEMHKALDSLDKVNASVLGGVINRVPTGRRESGYYYYYGSRYEEYSSSKGSKRKGKASRRKGRRDAGHRSTANATGTPASPARAAPVEGTSSLRSEPAASLRRQR